MLCSRVMQQGLAGVMGLVSVAEGRGARQEKLQSLAEG